MNFSNSSRLKRDLVIIFFSVVVGVVLLKTGWAKEVLDNSVQSEYFVIFLAGMLFTSVFTTVPATVVLGEMAQTTNLPLLAIVGGLGALCGDLLMFRFFKDSITRDLAALFTFEKIGRWRKIFRSQVFKVFLTLVGAVIIASPLPDELGLALMGFAKTKNWAFVALSFLCNSAGIFAIGLAARALLPH